MTFRYRDNRDKNPRTGRGRVKTTTMPVDEFMEATLDVWRIDPESARRVNHPAPFPIPLAKRLIDLYSYENDLVLDPFVGSGTTLVAADPAQAVKHAPDGAAHLILTYSHEIDLALCHAILSRDFHSAGLIGSATKWARFRTRLAALGHPSAQIARIACPIGDPALGKHPAAIALGVATAMMADQSHRTRNRTA